MGWFGKKNNVVVANTGTAIANGEGSVAVSGAMIGNIFTGNGGVNGLPISLEKKRDAARISLAKELPFTTKMSVMAFVDASGSMSGFYARGVVQELTERALGFSLAMDDDGQIPVYGFGFDHKLYGIVGANNYQGFVSRSGLGPYGSTNLSASLSFLEKAVKKAQEPVYALIVTDGAPDDRKDVERRLERLSKLQVFIKILVVGNDAGAWSFVKNTLDDNDWAIDNVDGQQMNDPSKLSDQQFADKMVEELSGWFRSAKDAGIIK